MCFDAMLFYMCVVHVYISLGDESFTSSVNRYAVIVIIVYFVVYLQLFQYNAQLQVKVYLNFLQGS